MADNELRVSDVPNGLVITSGRSDKTVMAQASNFVTSQAEGEWQMGRYTGGRRAPTHDEIARLAYSLYESRGLADGYRMEDWLRAEQQLVRHYA